jgi:hypothetical protein
VSLRAAAVVLAEGVVAECWTCGEVGDCECRRRAQRLAEVTRRAGQVFRALQRVDVLRSQTPWTPHARWERVDRLCRRLSRRLRDLCAEQDRLWAEDGR